MRRCVSGSPLRLDLMFSLVLVACGPSAPPPSSTTTPRLTPAATATTEPAACLPLVHGCGCAYDCALDTGAAASSPDHRIVQPSAGGAPIEVERATWCDGRASMCPGGRPGFYDLTGCGGECIPTRAWDGCHLENGRCVP